jgi:hypothetical protein
MVQIKLVVVVVVGPRYKINISKFQLDSVEEEPFCGTTVNSYLFILFYLFK